MYEVTYVPKMLAILNVYIEIYYMLFDINIYIDLRCVNIKVFFEGTYIWPFFKNKYASIFFLYVVKYNLYSTYMHHSIWINFYT